MLLVGSCPGGSGELSTGWEPPNRLGTWLPSKDNEEPLVLPLLEQPAREKALSGEKDMVLFPVNALLCAIREAKGWLRPKPSSPKKLLSEVGLPLWLLGGDISPEEPRL